MRTWSVRNWGARDGVPTDSFFDSGPQASDFGIPRTVPALDNSGGQTPVTGCR